MAFEGFYVKYEQCVSCVTVSVKMSSVHWRLCGSCVFLLPCSEEIEMLSPYDCGKSTGHPNHHTRVISQVFVGVTENLTKQPN